MARADSDRVFLEDVLPRPQADRLDISTPEGWNAYNERQRSIDMGAGYITR